MWNRLPDCGNRAATNRLRRNPMNARSLLLIASLCTVWPAAVGADGDEHACSVATLRGSFGFTFTGTANTPGGPSHRGGVGRFVFDGLGNLIGTVTSNS